MSYGNALTIWKPQSKVFSHFSDMEAAVIGSFQLFSNRYLVRLLDSIERRLGIVPGNKKDGSK